MRVLVAEAPGKANFPTMLSGGVQGQEKRRPKHKCCGKNVYLILMCRKESKQNESSFEFVRGGFKYRWF